MEHVQRVGRVFFPLDDELGSTFRQSGTTPTRTPGAFGELDALCLGRADGACVPLLHGEWAEVRTVSIGEVEEYCTPEGEHEIHVGQLSYFSRLTDAETFADLAEVEMRRRKVIQAEQVCAVTDGADWGPRFSDLQRSREGLMQYPQFRRQGWPIGSGMVESANKLVVEARLKGAGMRLRTQS